MKQLTLIGFALVFSFVLYGQRDWSYNPEFTYRGGFLLPHSGAVKPLMNGRIDFFEAGLVFPKLGSNGFKQTNRFSYWGVALNYTNFSNPEYLGFGIGLLPNLEMSLFKSKQSQLSFRMGFGIAYINKQFDRLENIRNGIIGTRANNTTDFQFRYKFHPTQKWKLSIGWGLLHYSNGALSRPNLGMNLPYINVSATYLRSPFTPHKVVKDSLYDKVKRYSVDINTFGGIKGGMYQLDNKFAVVGASAFFARQSGHHKYGVIVDVIYDQGLKFIEEDAELNWGAGYKTIDYFLIGAMLGYERFYGGVSLFMNVGMYLHSPYRTLMPNKELVNHGGYLYNRAGVKYYFGKWNVGLAVKAHVGEADNIEVILGYRITK